MEGWVDVVEFLYLCGDGIVVATTW